MKTLSYSFLAICSILIIGCDSKSDYDHTASGKSDSSYIIYEGIDQDYVYDNQLKVVSLNVRYASASSDTGDHAWTARRDACCAALWKQNPTVFGVQEAESEQMSYLATGTGYKSIGVGRDDGKYAGETMGIFYKEDYATLEDWGTFWLSETPDEPSYGWDATSRRTVTWAHFIHKGTGKRFFYMNTHLDNSGSQARKQSILLIIEKIQELNPDGYPTILTGDFNTSDTNSIFDPLKTYLANARENAPTTDNGGTLNNWGSSNSTIDHIFYSEGELTPRVFGVDRNPYLGIELISDHYPVYCLFDILKD